jgi:hypothetical protein
MDPRQDLTAEIVKEIASVVRKLGGDPDRLNLTDTWAVNRVLEFLGADTHLLCAIGSWRDTATDEQVLDDLKTWNEVGSQALNGCHPRKSARWTDFKDRKGLLLFIQ